jgi:hypothetical protein
VNSSEGCERKKQKTKKRVSTERVTNKDCYSISTWKTHTQRWDALTPKKVRMRTNENRKRQKKEGNVPREKRTRSELCHRCRSDRSCSDQLCCHFSQLSQAAGAIADSQSRNHREGCGLLHIRLRTIQRNRSTKSGVPKY